MHDKNKTTLRTPRLMLRRWEISDAEDLFTWASDKDVGPAAGWPQHKSVQESRNIIETVFVGSECYALCPNHNAEGLFDKEPFKNIRANTVIGCIELKLNGFTNLTNRNDECEMGFWIAKPFWGYGFIPEAAQELLRHAFDDLGMRTVWCGYYDGNEKSKRAQEKIGFVFHHTNKETPVPLLQETRTEHINYMTYEVWREIHKTETMY